MREAVIVAAGRSPMGRALKGQYVWTRIDDLAAEVIQKTLAQVSKLNPAEIEDLILGCAMPEGEQGMNLARNVGFLAGVPLTAGAVTVNRFCSSSLEAINIAALNIMAGNGEIFISSSS